MLRQVMMNRAFLPQGVTRRRFLIGATAIAGGFAVGFRPAGALAQEGMPVAQAPATATNPFAAYVTITTDDRITVISSQFDMGEGSYHGIATLVLEELGGRWDQTDVVGGFGNAALYGNLAWGGFAQGTGGSTSMASSWDRYRQAGATARAMLVAAAAEEWGVPGEEITVAEGMLSHPTSGSLSFGALAERAAAMPVPADVPLRAPEQWTLIGNDAIRRYDGPSKTDGTHPFTLDVRLPGMLTAVMIHPPKFGASVASFDAGAARAMPGVVDVVETPRGLAVVGEHMWAALKARDAVNVTWDETAAETRGTAEIMAEYRNLAAAAPAATALAEGDADAGLAGAARVLEATFEFPYLAHAALEPLNAVARMDGDGVLEVWGGHQMPDLYQMVAASVAGVPPERVRLHVMKTGGGFGRRGVADADVIVEAVAAARALEWRAPVKVQWTREDDMKGGRYRPAYVHKVRAGLDAEGRLVAWDHHVVGQSIMAGGPFEAMIQGGIDPTSVEGALYLPYAIPNRRVGLTTTDVRVPVLWWRAVGSTHTAYVVETFLDELAESAGADPLEFRLAMMAESPRHSGVLRLAAEKAGWGGPLPEGRARGIAMAESFQTYVAQVAEVSIVDGAVRVHKVVCAVDCGVPINPDNIRAQMEGGIGFGLGAILAEELTLTAGAVDQANYDAYTPLRIEGMPEVEVHIVPSTERPTGVGEPGVPPIGPAVANAIYALTGRRIRSLPIAKAMQS
jgi:isoquinoline 1-oxidoreductase beta subunit